MPISTEPRFRNCVSIECRFGEVVGEMEIFGCIQGMYALQGFKAVVEVEKHQSRN